jgi:ABC-type lipoprotein export system ATPase subunit
MAPFGSGLGINQFYFALSKGDVCAIESTHPDDAIAFIKALATLVRPLKGTYRWNGRKKDLNNYRELLACKQCIGYLAPDTALISNLTLRQNLLLRRYYFENTLNDKLDDELETLCTNFNILNKLDQRPTGLNSMETQAAILIREIIKKPQVLLLNRPEDFFGHANFEQISKLFGRWIEEQRPVVILSYDRRLVRRFANKKILITNGSLTTVMIR